MWQHRPRFLLHFHMSKLHLMCVDGDIAVACKYRVFCGIKPDVYPNVIKISFSFYLNNKTTSSYSIALTMGGVCSHSFWVRFSLIIFVFIKVFEWNLIFGSTSSHGIIIYFRRFMRFACSAIYRIFIQYHFYVSQYTFFWLIYLTYHFPTKLYML